MLLILKQPISGAVFIAIVMFGLYVPMGYYMDKFLYDRRLRKDAEAATRRAAEKAEQKAEQKKQKAAKQADEQLESADAE